MRNNRLSHDDVAALLNGTAPLGRPDLEPVATLVEDLRITSFESSPRPSAELAARLDSASWISPAAGGLQSASDRGAAPVRPAPTPKRGTARMIFTWFTGLGIAAKIAVGATVVAFGAVGAGAAQALPAPVQVGFNEVVDTLTPGTTADTSGDTATNTNTDAGTTTGTDATTTTDTSTNGTATGATTTGATVQDGTTTDTTTGSTTVDEGTTTDATAPAVDDSTDTTTDDSGKTAHAQAVTTAAHDDSTQGREHGKAVSAAAHLNKGTDDSVATNTDASVVGSDDESADSSVSTESGKGNSKSGKGKD